jgi:hypothetical protein
MIQARFATVPRGGGTGCCAFATNRSGAALKAACAALDQSRAAISSVKQDFMLRRLRTSHPREGGDPFSRHPRAPAYAARGNVEEPTEWTTNISHGELLRTGVDERLEVDPENLQFLFQGASDEEYRGRQYGTIPWRLGLLKLK